MQLSFTKEKADTMGVAENIKRLRELHGMTQEEFGKLAGVSAMAVSQWENGRAVPRMGAVERMATFLNVPKGEIIDGESRKTPKAITPPEPRQAYLPLLGRVHAGDAQEPQVLDERISLPYEIWEQHPDSWEDHYEDIVISDQEDHTVEYVGVVVWYQAAHEME